MLLLYLEASSSRRERKKEKAHACGNETFHLDRVILMEENGMKDSKIEENFLVNEERFHYNFSHSLFLATSSRRNGSVFPSPADPAVKFLFAVL